MLSFSINKRPVFSEIEQFGVLLAACTEGLNQQNPLHSMSIVLPFARRDENPENSSIGGQDDGGNNGQTRRPSVSSELKQS